MNLDFYFPTPIWWVDLDIDNDYLLKYIYDMRDKSEGRKVSNRGGWQSEEFPSDDIEELRTEVYKNAGRCILDYGMDPAVVGMFFGNCWANINTRGSTNQIHLHHGSFVSGVYYPYASEGAGKIFFYKNFDQYFISTSMAPIEKHTALSGGTVYYPAKTGRLLLFPSNLLHAVDENEDDEDRVSIAFNMALMKNE